MDSKCSGQASPNAHARLELGRSYERVENKRLANSWVPNKHNMLLVQSTLAASAGRKCGEEEYNVGEMKSNHP